VGSSTGQGTLPQAVGYGAGVQTTISNTTYLYIIGGYINNGSSTGNTIVYKSTVDSSGNIGSFTSSGQTQLPVGTAINTAAIGTAGGNTYIYKIGGYSGIGGYQSSVYKAQLDSSGNVGAWSGMTSLPATIGYASAASVTINGQTYIYLVGGIDGSNGLATVYKATLDSSGNTGTWTTAGQGTLPQSVSASNSIILNSGGTNYLYVIGGFTGTSSNSTLTTIYRAPIDSSGNVGSFSTSGQGQLPQSTSQSSSVVASINGSNYLYVMGGYHPSSPLATVYKAAIDNSGNIGTLSSTGQAALPAARTLGFGAVLPGAGGPYIGYYGGNNSTYQSTVWRMVLISAIGTDCDDEKAAPCPPTISASGVSSTQIDVSWSDGVGPTATSYKG
jgi:hypothetical protein